MAINLRDLERRLPLITTGTVLILGAGASMPYGFPSGAQLANQICGMGTSRLGLFGIQESATKAFTEALRGSDQSSVDAFLEHRPEFMDVGKTAIASILIEYEQEAHLRRPGEWYAYLLNRMTTSLKDFQKNRLAIITFNYDRSLEHYLFSTLQHRYGITPDEVARLLKDLQIIHVHGRLGFLPWQSSNPAEVRPYIADPSASAVDIAAKGIRIISEKDVLEQNPDFKKARELLGTARRIYFLGFGYHPENIRRLEVPFRKEAMIIEGSCHGMTTAESNHLSSKYTILRPYNGTCIDFLRNSESFQRD